MAISDRRRNLCALLALTAFGAIAGCAAEKGERAKTSVPTAAAEKAPLKVCLYANFQPFSGMVGEVWSGWDYDYLKAFAKQQSRGLEVVEKDFNGIWNQPGAEPFVCDIAGSGISRLPEREKETGAAAHWSATYYSVLRSYAVGKVDQLEGLADMVGQDKHGNTKRILVTEKSTADLDLRNRIACTQPNPDVTVVPTHNETESAQEVTDGKAYAYGGGLGSIQTLVEAPASNLKVAWTHCFMTAPPECKETGEPFSFVVRKASPGLAAELDKYIAATMGTDQDYQGNIEKRSHPDPIQCPGARPTI